MKFITLAIFLSLSTSFAEETLVLHQFLQGKNKDELSGLTYKDQKLYTVADKKKNHFIYEIELTKDSFSLKEAYNLKNGPYLNLPVHLKTSSGIKIPTQLDLEGISHCQNDFYLVDEQARNLLLFQEGELKLHTELGTQKLFEKHILHDNLELNAGLEGVAIDCENQIAYIAQERSPTGIIKIDLKKREVVDVFKPDPIEQKKYTYSGLYFDKNFLYALERNQKSIAKINPKTFKLEKRYFYPEIQGTDFNLIYDTGKPYGIEEGLALSSEYIFVVLDNNGDKLNKKFAKAMHLKRNKNHSLLIFKRPQGF